MQFSDVVDWAARPLEVFRERTVQTIEVWAVSARGIAGTIALPNLAKALNGLDSNDAETADPEREATRLHEIEEFAAVAKSIVDRQYTPLNEQAVVVLWGLLETAMEDSIVAMLTNDPSTLAIDGVAGMKVPIGVVLGRDGQDRARYVFEQAELQIAGKHRSPVGRFEALLDLFGLTSPLSDDLRRDVQAFGLLRNLLIHRDGYADQRFLDGWPEADLAVGHRVKVGRDEVLRYATAGLNYVHRLRVALKRRYPAPKSQAKKRTAKRARA